MMKLIIQEKELSLTGNVKDDEWMYRETTLLVPSDAVFSYKNAPGWKSFIVKGHNN